MLILMALFMLAMLTMVAIVIDLGQLRADRRDTQSASDFAALSAGYYLSGRGSAFAVSDPRGACEAALTTVKANVSAFPSTGTVDCNLLPATCTTATASVTIDSGTTAIPYLLAITYPVPDSMITESRFDNGEGVVDGAPCDRMMVSLTGTRDTSFARVIGRNSQTYTARSVVNGKPTSESEGVAALLLLERVGCGSLQTSGGGTAGEGIVVEAPDDVDLSTPPDGVADPQPGVIQDDSAGVVGSTAANPLAPCGSGVSGNANNYVVYGTALPAGTPSINVEPASNGSPGILGLFSLKVGGKGGYIFPGGLSVPPSLGPISSRNPADVKYNKPIAGGGSAQITTLHSTGYARSSAAALGGDQVLSGNQECKGNITDPAKLNAVNLYADCTTFEPEVNIFPNLKTFVVRGNISIKSNKLLSLPVAETVYVRGCAAAPTGCSGGNTFAIDVANNGALLVNTGEVVSPPDLGGVRYGGGTACAARSGPGAGGSTNNWTKIATFSGNFPVAGLARLCQTAVYLGKDAPTYVRQAVEAVNVAPENYPAVAECSATKPCPMMSGYDASVNVSGSTDWSAPNQLAVKPTAADFNTNPFEDLALWSESDSTSTLKGQGLNSTEGVYFLPNSNATFTGQGVQPIALNAQYFVRTLNVSSQGTLRLKPTAADAIPSPIAGGFGLIR